MNITKKVALLLTLGCALAQGVRGQPTILTSPDFQALQVAMVSDTNVLLHFNGVVQFPRPIVITGPMTLDGSGYNVVFEGTASRLFVITNGAELAINSVTIRGGYAQSSSGGAFAITGGALTLNECTVTNNRALAGSPHPYYDSYNPSPVFFIAERASAGVIEANGARLNFTNCVFSDNHAEGGNGSANTMAAGAYGGVLEATGCQITIDGCIFANNSASGGAMGIYQSYDFSLQVDGGAIRASGGALIIGRSLFASNSCSGGYYYFVNEIGGGGAVCAVGAVLDIRSSTFIGNSIATDYSTCGKGGALCSTGPSRIDDSIFVENVASQSDGGGAIALIASASITNQVLRSSFVSNSTAIFYGGGGGAIFTANPLAISQSSFAFNRATGQASVATSTFTNQPARVFGGAIYETYTSTLNATNCIFVSNVARSGDGFPASGSSTNFLSHPAQGGAVFAYSAALTAISFASNAVEIASNPDTNFIPAGGTLSCPSPQLQATLLTGLSNISLLDSQAADLGFNICSDNSAHLTNATSLNNTDPLLQYFPDQKFSILRPAANSPAIGRVTTRLTDVDIRGALRGELPHDSGAVELDGTTSLSIGAGVGGLTVSAANYLEGLKILGSDDLKSWTEVGMASPTNSVSALSVTPGEAAGWRFYKAQVAP